MQPKDEGYFCNFHVTGQMKQPPNGQKIAHSGHPGHWHHKVFFTVLQRSWAAALSRASFSLTKNFMLTGFWR
jgi:hypothetical protein